MRLGRPGAPALALVLMGCATIPTGSWRASFEPASVCLEVDLGDGVDATDLTEFRALFGCLDAHGHLAALRGTVDALELAAPDGRPAASSLIDTVAVLASEGTDAWSDSLDALAEVDRDTALVVIRGADGPVDASAGPLPPLAGVLPRVAEATLAEDGRVDRLVALADALLPLRTAIGDLGRATTPDRVALRTTLVDDLLTVATHPSGRPAVQAWLVDDPPLWGRVATPVSELARAALPVADWADRDLLDPALDGVVWLDSVAADGSPSTGDSALDAALRAVAAGDGPLSCSLDLVVVDLEVLELDNLSLTVLTALAQADPEAADAGLDVLGLVFDDGLIEWALRTAVARGLCDGLTPEVLDDLEAVERLSDPEVGELWTVAVEGLATLEPAELRAALDLAVALHEHDALPVTVPLLAVPRAGSIDATLRDLGGAPAMDALGTLTAADTTRDSLPVLSALLAPEGTWTALSRLADARAATSALHDPGPLLAGLDEPMPAAEVLTPALHVLAVEEVAAALLASGPPATSPLPWLGELLADDTLDDLQQLVERWLGPQPDPVRE